MLTQRETPNSFKALTPSDTTDLSRSATRGLYVATAGTVYVQGTGDSAIVLLGTFSAGTFIPGAFKCFGANSTATVVGVSGP